jgi:hypothetical protein
MIRPVSRGGRIMPRTIGTKGERGMSRAEKLFMIGVGQELRAWREATGDGKQRISLEAVSKLFGWQRAAMSKKELGESNITLFDYMRLVGLFEEYIAKDHPALLLFDYLRGLTPVDIAELSDSECLSG